MNRFAKRKSVSVSPTCSLGRPLTSFHGLFLSHEPPLRDAIELQALASKSKAAATSDKEGVNCLRKGPKKERRRSAFLCTSTLPSFFLSPPQPPPPTADATATTTTATTASSPVPALPARAQPAQSPARHPLPARARRRALRGARAAPPAAAAAVDALPRGLQKGRRREGAARSRFSQQAAAANGQRQQQRRRATRQTLRSRTQAAARRSSPAPTGPARPGRRIERGRRHPSTHSWRCTTRPRCSYQETPPERIAAPRLALEVVLAANCDEGQKKR